MNIENLLKNISEPDKFNEELYFTGLLANKEIIKEFITTPAYLNKLISEWSAYPFKKKKPEFDSDGRLSHILRDMLDCLSVSDIKAFIQEEMFKKPEKTGQKYASGDSPLIMLLIKNKLPKTICLFSEKGYQLSEVESVEIFYKQMTKDVYPLIKEKIQLSEYEVGELFEKTIIKNKNQLDEVLSKMLSEEETKALLFSYIDSQRIRDVSFEYYLHCEDGNTEKVKNASLLYKQIVLGKTEVLLPLMQAGLSLNMKEYALMFNCLYGKERPEQMFINKKLVSELNKYPTEYKKEFFLNMVKYLHSNYYKVNTPVFAEISDIVKEIIPVLNEREFFCLKGVNNASTINVIFDYCSPEQQKTLLQLWNTDREKFEVARIYSTFANLNSYEGSDYIPIFEQQMQDTLWSKENNEISELLEKLIDYSRNPKAQEILLNMKIKWEKEILNESEQKPGKKQINRI